MGELLLAVMSPSAPFGAIGDPGLAVPAALRENSLRSCGAAETASPGDMP